MPGSYEISFAFHFLVVFMRFLLWLKEFLERSSSSFSDGQFTRARHLFPRDQEGKIHFLRIIFPRFQKEFIWRGQGYDCKWDFISNTKYNLKTIILGNQCKTGNELMILNTNTTINIQKDKETNRKLGDTSLTCGTSM